MTENEKNNEWVTMNDDFVASELVGHWLSQVMKSRLKSIAESRFFMSWIYKFT